MNTLKTIAGWVGIAMVTIGVTGFLILAAYVTWFRFQHVHYTETELFLKFWRQELTIVVDILVGFVLLQWGESPTKKREV